ncbi:23S rRNA (pseudouridine(1915)-N(3))-methyltransferase RlmH [bacterium]|nr:23S rRNA (pseudouridine(1915)-N(3))-methyltransferase RlmH [bacterium]
MIRIISVGRIKEKYLKDGMDEYIKRLSKFTKLEMIELKDIPVPDKASLSEENEIKKEEGKEILSRIKDDYVIALDLKGEMLDSVSFSKKIEEINTSGKSKITFVIGGSLGLSKEVIDRSNYQLSFSPMTFPHQLFKLILLEQIYRAYKILNNETYHK